MIEFKNVSRFYGELKALDTVSFKIDKGEIVGLLGPNGAGKSTSMKLMSGLIFPDSGEITIDEKNMKDNSISLKSKIGFMPENNPLYKDMTVKESFDYVMELRSVPKEKRKASTDEIVKSTGIAEVFYRNISELSKGYKQRVGIGLVLIGDPEVLILDEPTEGLDPNQRVEIRSLIKKLGENRTVIISTHVMQEVEAVCTRIILINKGKLITDGSKDSILNRKSATNSVTLKLKTSTSPETKLKEIKSIEKLSKDKKEADVHTFELQIKDKEKFLKDFTSTLKSSDWIIEELSYKQESLEEIFKELTA